MYENLIDCFEKEDIGNIYSIKYITVTEAYNNFWDLTSSEFEIKVGKPKDKYWDDTGHFNYELLEEEYKVYKEELVIVIEDRESELFDVINIRTGQFIDFEWCHVVSTELKVKNKL